MVWLAARAFRQQRADFDACQQRALGGGGGRPEGDGAEEDVGAGEGASDHQLEVGLKWEVVEEEQVTTSNDDSREGTMRNDKYRYVAIRSDW